jgi:hypothetical protein
MANHENDMQSSRVGAGNQQLVIITQLLRMSVSMRHIDEMFLWLSQIIVQRLGVEVIQFWASQNHITGLHSAELRAIACQNSLFPLQIVNNTQVSKVIKDVLIRQSGIGPQPIVSIFSPHQVELLRHYHLFYWGCFSLSSNLLLPLVMSNEVSQGAVPTPLNMAVLLFTQQTPHPQLLPSIKRILEQSLSIASNRGLLSNVAYPQDGNLIANQAKYKGFIFNELILHWTKDIESLQAENPLSSSIVINNKLARQIYFAVDGKKSILDLITLIQCDQQDFNSALYYLLRRKLIRLHAPNGIIVDSTLFLEELL